MTFHSDEYTAEYIEYAKSIGCVIVHDSITATYEQSKLLAAWWSQKRQQQAVSGFRTGEKNNG